MKPYVIMIQADADDRYFADATLQELKPGFGVEYITQVNEIDELIQKLGLPRIIMINDNTRRSATEQLKLIKNDVRISHIPVIILGEIAATDYIRKFYIAGACSYVIKPSTVAATHKKVELFFKYWFDVAEL